MSLASIHSRALTGIDAPPVTVEVHLAGGLPNFSIVGLPETAVRESKDRVRAALLNSGFDFPSRRITVNLAPADLPKEGGRFDLPIALGILVASRQLPGGATEATEFIAELALSGALRPVRGALPSALAAARAGRALVVAADNGAEAALAADCPVYPATDLLALCAHLLGRERLAAAAPPPRSGAAAAAPDLDDVAGQARAKRALTVAAAGEHNLLLIGPPGTGKSMLAHRLPALLPALTEAESLEVAALRSIAQGGFSCAGWGRRPFRAPHHTASAIALVGGGSHPRPGEISLAHNGVLFLDELPEFDRRVLEVLREPMESGRIVISRAARQAEFPARFQLIAAMNPCPCGHLGDAGQVCRCGEDRVQRYRARLSGPLLDRIDMQVAVPRVPPSALREPAATEPASRLRGLVQAARDRQARRQGKCNARLEPGELAASCALAGAEAALLEQAVERLRLSARAYHRVLKLARTLADLDGAQRIAAPHLAEALGYRCLDRAQAL